MEFEYQNQKTVRSVGNLAFFYRAKGFYQKAEDVCRSFLQDVEDNANVRQWLIRSYLCHKRFDLALAEAEKISFIDPSLKSEKGVVLFCKDDLAGAGKILGVDYNWNDAFLLVRGMINETFWFWPKQLIFERLEGDKGKDVGAWGQMALVQEKNGRYREAYQAFAQYLKLSAEYRKSAGESGLPYLPSQQKSDLFIKGRIQAELKSFDEARKTAEELKLLIDKEINRKEIRYYEYILGLIELEKKNYRQAADFFSRACGRLDFEYGYDTDHALFFDPLARTLYEWGDLDKAREEYEKITLLTLGRFYYGDIYAKAYYMLGKIYAKLGQKGKAVENYSKFSDLWKDCDLQFRPMVEEAKEQVKKLGGK